MAKRRLIACLLAVALSCVGGWGLAEAPDLESGYQGAVALIDKGAYREALPQLVALGDYKSSAKYTLYAMGMTALENDLLGDAQAYFEALAARGFLDSQQLALYAQARGLEGLGEKKQAMDIYAQLDVMDSMIRQVTLLRALQKEQGQ